MSPEVAAEALFCSDLDPHESHPNGSTVRCTIADTLARLGEAECAARLAQAYGDNQIWAAERMRWALWTVSWAYTTAGAR